MNEEIEKIINEVLKLQAYAMTLNVNNIEETQRQGLLKTGELSIANFFLATIAMELSLFPDLYLKSTDEETQKSIDYLNNIISSQRIQNILGTLNIDDKLN